MPATTLDRAHPVLKPLDPQRLVTTPGTPRLVHRPVLSLVVCHPAPLAGQAIAAALRSGSDVSEVAVVRGVNDLVRESGRHYDVALVSETIGADLPELLQALSFRGVALPVVVMATVDDPAVVAEYLEWGAAGSIDMRRPLADVLARIQQATTGAPVVDAEVRPGVVRALRSRVDHRSTARAELAALSGRERKVIEYLARGTGVADIALALHLSPHTIRACISGLGPKLGVTGQLRIAARARDLFGAAHEPAPTRYLFQLRGGSRLQLSC